MALKFDQQWWRDPDGNVVFGDLSIVNCSDDDPRRFKDSEGERIVSVESEPQETPR